MKHLGDITKINGAKAPVVDIITGGSPCQDLSVAGKRAGLAGERSGLFMEQIRIIKEMRKHDKETNRRTNEFIRPRWMVWENVPGAFSSNGGEDFRAVLEETARVADENAVIPRLAKGQKWTPAGCIMGDGWSIAWRVHDAQFWGVPQRRKRISLVADFGGTTAPEILFERKGLSGDIEESGETGKGVAKDAERCIRETSASGFPLGFRAENTKTYDEKATTICNGTRPGFTCGVIEANRAVSFQERAGKPGGGKGILIQNERTGALSTLNNQSVVYGISAYDSNSMKSPNPNSGIYKAETARTLDLNGGSPACNQGGMAVVCLEGNGARPSHQGNGYAEGETMYTLNSTEHHGICYDARGNGSGKIAPTITGDHQSRVTDYTAIAISEVAAGLCAQDGRGGVHSQRLADPEGNFVLEPVVASKASHFTHGIEGGVSDTLYATDYKEPQLVAFEEEKIATQVAKGPGANCAAENCQKVESIVRRLTPMECERLQGYPDGWTDIGDWTDSKGKTHKGDSDAPRYKALGNSIALPFWEWMAKRITAYITDHKPTMASLFDGIGGFPLVFSRSGADPIWASEIEEFPIAVTKIRFPEKEEE